MRKILCLLALGQACAFAAAPASLVGKVYRDRGRQNVGVIATFQYWESTIVFGADGRYHYVWNGGGSDLGVTPEQKGRIFVGSPPADGTYTYTRLDDTHATIGLLDPSGTLPLNGSLQARGISMTLNLTFDSESGGYVNGLPAGGSVVSSYYLFSLSDLAAAQTAPAANVSMRSRVVASNPVIVGFVVPGTAEREALIRVAGPALGAFGITSAWVTPDFQLFRGAVPAAFNEWHYGAWSSANTAGMRRIFDYAGAFPFATDSKDAANIVRLSPGAYTVVCTAPPGDPGGEALIEIYFLP